MQRAMGPIDPEEPVFVIDLRAPVMREVAQEIEAASAGAFVPRVMPPPPERDLRCVALIVDGPGDPILLPIAPTRDVRLLDALARLVRFAVVREMPVRDVATRYGDAYERGLVERRELPAWAIDGVDASMVHALPADVRRALA